MKTQHQKEMRYRQVISWKSKINEKGNIQEVKEKEGMERKIKESSRAEISIQVVNLIDK